MKRIMSALTMAALALCAHSQGTMTISGRITGAPVDTAYVIEMSGSGARYDTVLVGSKGKFSTTVTLSHASIGYFAPGDYRLRTPKLFLEPGTKAKIEVNISKNNNAEEQRELPYAATYKFKGDNRDCFDYLHAHDFQTDRLVAWPFSRVEALSFNDYKAEYAKWCDEQKGYVAGVKSQTFRDIVTGMIDDSMEESLCRYGWSRNYKGDADYDAFMQSLDHNNPDDLATAQYYLRWYFRKYPLGEGENQFERLKKAFSNQDIVNHFADRMVLGEIEHATGDMQKLMADYKAVSTNQEGWQRAEEALLRYSGLMKGAPLKDVEFTDQDGNTHHLAEFKGKAVYLDVWATWCGPCVAEISHLEKLVEKYKDNNKVVFISVSFDRNRKAWLQKLSEDKPTWPQFITSEGDLQKQYGVYGIPRFLYFDAEGRIVSVDAPRPSDAKIEQFIDSAL